MTEEESLRNQLEKVKGVARSVLDRNAKLLQDINKMLKEASKTAFLAAGGTEEGFKKWYKQHCKLNLN